MAGLKIMWEQPALKLLETRDRYTRKSIQDAFGKDPQRNAIAFDPEHGGYVTPVSDGRFCVVWRLDGGQAVVRAVVPLPNVGGTSITGLKEYVQRAVRVESKGEIVV